MTIEKCLGIRLDHAEAHLIEFTTDPIETKTLESAFTRTQKEETLNRSENIMHNKEQQQQHEYYKKLGEVIKNYDNILLFGATDAKTELFNMLRKDHHFDKIKIEIQPSDKMTENQEHAFVKAYFSEH
jgi:DNA-binding LytR/AlgR family response regulator